MKKSCPQKSLKKMAGTVFDLMVFEETYHNLEDENDVLAIFFEEGL